MVRGELQFNLMAPTWTAYWYRETQTKRIVHVHLTYHLDIVVFEDSNREYVSKMLFVPRVFPVHWANSSLNSQTHRESIWTRGPGQRRALTPNNANIRCLLSPSHMLAEQSLSWFSDKCVSAYSPNLCLDGLVILQRTRARINTIRKIVWCFHWLGCVTAEWGQNHLNYSERRCVVCIWSLVLLNGDRTILTTVRGDGWCVYDPWFCLMWTEPS